MADQFSVAVASMEQKSNLKWPQEMEADLIDEISKSPSIWNIRHPLYTKRVNKKEECARIAEHLSRRWHVKLTADHVLAKYQNLRAYYRKERKKYTLHKSGTGAETSNRKWLHFSRLQFLDEIIIPTSSTTNLDEIEVVLEVTIISIIFVYIPTF